MKYETARAAALIVPTYNEAENIEGLTERILRLVPGLSVYIVDDASPDGTGPLADELAARHSRVRVIHRPGKLGLGTAYRDGFLRAMAEGARYLLSMDADFSHDPAALPGLLTFIPQADVVIGSRYVDGGRTVNFALHRRFISQSANTFAHEVLALTPRDCTSGFRCYRREILEALDLSTIKSNGYSFLIEILYRCQQHEARITEYPITYVAREQGLSKISRQEIAKALWTIFSLRAERTLQALKGR
jgi:dolichol-phosphate mannosyltransferase